MSLPAIRIAAARYVLSDRDSLELRRVADQALDAGVYTHALGELATLPNPTYWEVTPLFTRALRELGIRLPSPEEAIRTLLTHFVRCIVEGTLTPYEGLWAIMRELYYPGKLPRTQGAEDPYRMQHLASCFYTYEEFSWSPELVSAYGKSEEEALAALDREVVARAAEWKREHSAALIAPAWLTWNDATLPKVARALLDEQAFDRLPILADALEEAGCQQPEVLEHCRYPGRHVRGCWVLDLLLAPA